MKTTPLFLILLVLLTGCNQFSDTRDKISTQLVIDFNDSRQPIMIIPVELEYDTALTVYDLLEQSGLDIEYDPRYNSPPFLLLNKIEGKPKSSEEGFSWAVFVRDRDQKPWKYQNVGIGEINVFEGMEIGFSLTRWEYVNETLVPLYLPGNGQLMGPDNSEGNTPKFVQAVNYHEGNELSIVANLQEEIVGCGGFDPEGISRSYLKIGSFKVNKRLFHRSIKPRILRDSPKFQHKVGSNPDIGIHKGKIQLNGTGPFKGKSLDTGLNPQNYFNQ